MTKLSELSISSNFKLGNNVYRYLGPDGHGCCIADILATQQPDNNYKKSEYSTIYNFSVDTEVEAGKFVETGYFLSSEYKMIYNGDHIEYEIENENTKPEDRTDWPLPSFDAKDWASAFCKVSNKLGFKDAEGNPIDEGWIISWMSCALMRGFDEHGIRVAKLIRKVSTLEELKEELNIQD